MECVCLVTLFRIPGSGKESKVKRIRLRSINDSLLLSLTASGQTSTIKSELWHPLAQLAGILSSASL